MSTKNLLVELFVEELPPKALRKLGEAFGNALFDNLRAAGLLTETSTLTSFASPRRLAAHVSGVLAQAADKAVSQKLMPVSVGLDANGAPTPALVKKLAALGLDASVVPQLKRAMDGKAEAFFYDSQVKGAMLVEGLQKALNEALAKLPIPKVMTYQLRDGWSTVSFVRPAHGLVALHGADIVNVSVLGLTAGRATQGHRFEAKANPVSIRDADSYEAQLENEGAVIASFDKRRAEIARQLAAAAAKAGNDARPIEDEALLDEVTALVERPNVLCGKFDEAFLAVPPECLILTMKANQKYFPLLDGGGKLTNKFLLVSNITPVDPTLVIGGNERVVRPRLADAKFFFDQDRKSTLESRVPRLANVVYHNKLGSQLQRVERLMGIAGQIAVWLGADKARAELAARLAKADLLTDMVGEFPALQGIMGRYYALHEGESAEVAAAVEQHYWPRFAGDVLPQGPIATAVALADRLDALAGMFGIGQVPTGDKDPFGLRRAALGVIRIVIEKDLPLQLDALVELACAAQPANARDAKADILLFVSERLSGYLRESGASPQEADAVLAGNSLALAETPKVLKAVQAFQKLPEAAALAAANKRIVNILKKTGKEYQGAKSAQLAEPAERALYETLQKLRPEVESSFKAHDYTAALQRLAALKQPVDAFFDSVMVMAEDAALRENRLALLGDLRQLMNRVADISRLAAQ